MKTSEALSVVIDMVADLTERTIAAEAAVAPLKAENVELRSRCQAIEDAAKITPEIDLTGVEKLIADEIAKLPTPDVAEDVERQLAPLKVETDDLRARLKALEDRPIPGFVELAATPELPDFEPIVQDAVAKAVGALPKAKDGKNGAGVAGALIDRDGNLILTLSNGETRDLGKVVGKDGENGSRGLGFDDLDVCVLDDDRTIELAFRRGGEEKVFTLKWPTVIDRGVFKQGEAYQAGDAVTWGGCLWIAQKETEAKPDTPESGWRLAVKKGRDGKDAKNG